MWERGGDDRLSHKQADKHRILQIGARYLIFILTGSHRTAEWHRTAHRMMVAAAMVCIQCYGLGFACKPRHERHVLAWWGEACCCVGRAGWVAGPRDLRVGPPYSCLPLKMEVAVEGAGMHAHSPCSFLTHAHTFPCW